MSSVLAAVGKCLGIGIRTPTGFADERIFTHFGPGPALRVLDDLLGSTDLNYAIVLSGAAAPRVASVVLTSRAGDAAESKGEETGTSASGASMTSARRLWTASQATSGRPASTASDADPLLKDPATPASPGAPEKTVVPADAPAAAMDGASAPLQGGGSNAGTATGGNDEAAAAATAASAAAASAPATSPAQPTTPGTAPAPAPADAAAGANPPANVLAPQINQMQQMFEQRRKLNSSPAAAAPVPDPSSSPQQLLGKPAGW